MKFLFVFLLLWVSLSLISQDSLNIFDRPGIADSPYLVPKKTAFVEAGIGFSDKTQAQDLLYPSILFRKRLGKTNEVRVATSTFPQSYQLIKDVTEIHPIIGSIGIKQKICTENKFIPESAVMVNAYFNFSSKKEFNLSNFIWECQFLFNSNVNEFFSVNYNFGYIHYSTQQQHYIHQSTCLNFKLTKKTGLFIESFNYISISSKKNEFSYDLGLTHHLSKKIQFDISYIANNYLGAHFGTVLTGISFAFN